jgi:hypothetical protein
MLAPAPAGSQTEFPFWQLSSKVPACQVSETPGRRVVTSPFGAPAPVIDPATLAESYWTTVPLPVPKPSLPPGYAVTGLRTYLVTGGTIRPRPFVRATPLGLLSIQATGSYTVDWGDNSFWSGPYSQEGEPWPAGTISHTYDVAGTVRIMVRESWSARWSLAGVGGSLAGLHTEATIGPLVVRQLQAVITG